MSSTTVLQLIQQATGELGLTVPSTAVGNTNQDVVQILALINAVGYELQRKHDWQALCKAHFFTAAYTSTTGTTTSGSAAITAIPSTTGISTAYQAVGGGIPNNAQITSVDSATQVTLNQAATSSNTAETIVFAKTQYALPSDYDRQIDSTHWDKSENWIMVGPETAQQWEWLVSGFLATGPRVHYRILADLVQIWPPQTTTTNVLGFEYVSKNWAAAAAGTAKAAFTVDTDTCIFYDRLMVLGLKSKYYQAKGLANVYESEYRMELDLAKSNDAGSQTLSMIPRPTSSLITAANIPDGGYGT